MAEYIDRDELLQQIDCRVNAYYDEHYQIKDLCTQLIENAPTEDVVPRSKYEKLKELNNQLEIDIVNANMNLDHIIQEIDQIQKDKAEVTYLKEQLIAKAKQEVVREIFEDFIREIEFQKRKAEASKNSFCTPYSEDYHFWRGKECGLERLLEYVVKKEKKYIGEKGE